MECSVSAGPNNSSPWSCHFPAAAPRARSSSGEGSSNAPRSLITSKDQTKTGLFQIDYNHSFSAAGSHFLKGGVGYGSTRFSNSRPATASGFGFLAGVGYDIRVGGNISLTPVANFYFGSDGDMTENGTKVISSLKHNVFDIGLGITFH